MAFLTYIQILYHNFDMLINISGLDHTGTKAIFRTQEIFGLHLKVNMGCLRPLFLTNGLDSYGS